MRIRRGPTEALVGARPWWKDAHCVVHKLVPLAATIDPALGRVQRYGLVRAGRRAVVAETASGSR